MYYTSVLVLGNVMHAWYFTRLYEYALCLGCGLVVPTAPSCMNDLNGAVARFASPLKIKGGTVIMYTHTNHVRPLYPVGNVLLQHLLFFVHILFAACCII